MFLQILS